MKVASDRPWRSLRNNVTTPTTSLNAVKMSRRAFYDGLSLAN